jgi:hypothetical protein
MTEHGQRLRLEGDRLIGFPEPRSGEIQPKRAEPHLGFRRRHRADGIPASGMGHRMRHAISTVDA